MTFEPEPDERGPILFVGQDAAGHWLVQDEARRIEGRFVSRRAALSFAEGERALYHGAIRIAATPLVPSIAFGPALSRAA